MDLGLLTDIFHDFSSAIIAGIVLLSMVVSLFVFKYFDHDLWNQDSWSNND